MNFGEKKMTAIKLIVFPKLPLGFTLIGGKYEISLLMSQVGFLMSCFNVLFTKTLCSLKKHSVFIKSGGKTESCSR